MERNKIYIYGKYAVMEALLHAPQVLNKVFIAPDVHDAELNDVIRKAGISVARLKKGAKTKGDTGPGHQGIFASVSLHKLIQPFDAFVDGLKAHTDTALVYLDELTDPHNVGAIIRSAAALGVAAVLMPTKGQAPITGAVIKVSAGMAFRIPLVAVDDPARALDYLKNNGFTLYGLSGDGECTVADLSFDAPTVFVFGNESRGLSEKTKRLCDELVSIAIHPRAESLNVAAVAAITLHTWSTRHTKALE